MNAIEEILDFEREGWVIEIKEIINSINPTDPKTWANRLNKELQTKLAYHSLQVGYYMRIMQQIACDEFHVIRGRHKSKADAEIEWQTTTAYKNWKMAKTFHKGLENLIYALRFEVKEEFKQSNQ